MVPQANSQEQVAQAHFAIAECHEELGDIDAAVTALEQYMDLTRLSSPLAHSQACCKFGALYYRAGEYTQVRSRHAWHIRQSRRLARVQPP